VSRLHLVLTLAWAALAVPAVLWWHDSVLFVILASIYANMGVHWSAYSACHAEEALLKKVGPKKGK
jgi:hypothetical protein